MAALSAWVIDETVSHVQWLGIALICGGVLGLAAQAPAIQSEQQSARHRSATGYALANAFVIAAYTMIDGLGVRHADAPAAYPLWVFLLTGIEMLLWISIRRRREFISYLRGKCLQGIAGGCGTLASYTLALWAMTIAPVALVAALRETSILFATVISALVLKERVTALRLACIGLIIGGAMA